jgi:Tfp pilus assembly major pilin PilA
MLDINLPNFITVGVIAIVAAIGIKTLAKAMNKQSPV